MPASRTSRRRRRGEISAVLGALALLVGVFAPALRVSVYGDVSYFDAFEAQGTAIVIAAAASLFAVVRRTGSWLRFTAPGAWIALLWPVLGNRLLPRDDNLFARLGDAVGSEVGRVTSDFALRFTDFSWGPWVLLAGCGLLTVAAVRVRC